MFIILSSLLFLLLLFPFPPSLPQTPSNVDCFIRSAFLPNRSATDRTVKPVKSAIDCQEICRKDEQA